MKRSNGRILTTHVGSLVRTPEIIEARIRGELGTPVEAGEYERTLAEGVRDVVRRQVAAGIDVVDDGEYGKLGWTPYVAERFAGLEQVDAAPPAGLYPEPERFGEFYREYLQHETTQWLPETPSRAKYKGTMKQATLACTGPLEYMPDALERDIANLKRALDGVEVEDAFMPVAGPASIEIYPNQHYPSQEEYLFALADALSAEYRLIVEAGFIVQVDDAILPVQRFMSFLGKPLAEYKAWAELRIDALNRALDGIPEDRVRYHICYGAQNIPHTSDPPLSEIVDLVLRVNAQAYAIESANPRHAHEWELWSSVDFPEGKILIPGVVSHCTNVVESPELVAQRLSNFAGLIGRENVIAGTDCGFSQFWNLIRVHPQIQWAKLEALAEGAQLASSRLWS
jgi:5-methyltetrahydropteroyltriglutamate--homocysteine methyltransferase